MLQYIVWSGTPPSFPTMIDAIAVRLEESPEFVEENRLFDLMDVIVQCSSLLIVVDVDEWQEIHLAHSSVKEYLTSQSLVCPFDEALSEVHARAIIAKTCIRYIIDVFNLRIGSMDQQRFMKNVNKSAPPSCDPMDNLDETMELPFALTGFPTFPFMQCAIFWMEHARVSGDADLDLVQLVLQFYRTWHLLCSFPPILEYGSYTPNLDLSDSSMSVLILIHSFMLVAGDWSSSYGASYRRLVPTSAHAIAPYVGIVHSTRLRVMDIKNSSRCC